MCGGWVGDGWIDRHVTAKAILLTMYKLKIKHALAYLSIHGSKVDGNHLLDGEHGKNMINGVK